MLTGRPVLHILRASVIASIDHFSHLIYIHYLVPFFRFSLLAESFSMCPKLSLLKIRPSGYTTEMTCFFPYCKQKKKEKKREGAVFLEERERADEIYIFLQRSRTQGLHSIFLFLLYILANSALPPHTFKVFACHMCDCACMHGISHHTLPHTRPDVSLV